MYLGTKILLFFLVPVALAICPFVLPLYTLTFDISIVLSVVSLVFAVLVGFFIATATTNYLNLQSLVVREDTALISIYQFIQIVSPPLSQRFAEVVDVYSTLSLHFDFTEYVAKTRAEFNDVITVINQVVPVDQKGFELFASLHAKKSELTQVRQDITLAADRIVTWRHWLVLLLLSAVIVTLLLSLRDGALLTASVVGVISLAIYVVLNILYQVDNNIFLEEKLAYQNTQEVLRAINVSPYFPEESIGMGRVSKLSGEYRIGRFKDYPHSMEREVRLVNTDN